MDTRRALGYAYAIAGNPGRAAERMLEAAVRLSYQAHGLDTALDVWREGRDALQRNEDLYLATAVADGSVLAAEEDGVTATLPPWWDPRLDAFEDRYSGEPRTWLVTQLLDAGEIGRARALADAIEAGGKLGWPLTLAQVRIAIMDPDHAGQDAQSEQLPALTAPLLDQWAVSNDDLTLELEPGDAFIRVLRLHDRPGPCENVRRATDHLASLARTAADGAEATGSDPGRPRAWQHIGFAC